MDCLETLFLPLMIAPHIVDGLGFGLDEIAEAAMQPWRFRPAIKDGQPVDVSPCD
jgi:hypothetical protein